MPNSEALEQKSPAEFFSENKNIAGFDNPGKCLYTTVRELVENSLDAAESISALPDIAITLEEIGQKALNQIRGIANRERVDEELYKEFEDENTKKKRLAKEAKELQKLESTMTKKGATPEELAKLKKELEAKRAAKAAKGTKIFYKVTVKDNGMGMPHKDIPNLLGRVLSGTKYGVRQTRGKFGLGAKMALIWSKMSTGMPLEIWSAQDGSSSISHYLLDIDIYKNEPNVHRAERLPNAEGWRGTMLAVTIQGSLQTGYRSKLLKYLQQIAVITPYAAFTFAYRSEDGSSDLRYDFKRRTKTMPEPPKAVKHHPASVDLELTKRLLSLTKTKTLQDFLSREFSCVSKAHAARLISESGMKAGVSPAKLTTAEITQLHQLLHEARFADPPSTHLSPAGEYNLRLGIMKEMDPKLLATYQGAAHVLEGHAFIVEAAVCYGDSNMKPGITIHRFANRIPLLFEEGSDVITRTTLKRINWGNYKMRQATDKIGVFVSIVSTRIPYKGASKEYIADDMEQLVVAVKQAVQLCCSQLRTRIVKLEAAKAEENRRKELVKYIEYLGTVMLRALTTVAENQGKQPCSKRRREIEARTDIIERVRCRKLSESDVRQALREYVEKIDTEQAIEATVHEEEDLRPMPLTAEHVYGPPLRAEWGTVQFLRRAA